MARFAAGILLGAITGTLAALLLLRWGEQQYVLEDRRARA